MFILDRAEHLLRSGIIIPNILKVLMSQRKLYSIPRRYNYKGVKTFAHDPIILIYFSGGFFFLGGGGVLVLFYFFINVQSSSAFNISGILLFIYFNPRIVCCRRCVHFCTNTFVVCFFGSCFLLSGHRLIMYSCDPHPISKRNRKWIKSH